MRKLWLLIIAGLILVAVNMATAGKKPSGGQFPVTAEFREPPLGVDDDRIDSDGGGIYDDGVERVSATIQSGAHRADFVLNVTNSKGVRRLFVRFDALDCIPLGTCSPPFVSDTVFFNAVMQTRAANLPSLPLGVPTRQRLQFGFSAPDPNQNNQKVAWFVFFDPEDATTACRSSFVWVTKTAQNPDVWVIEADSADEACLSVQVGNSQQKAARGKFHMPFQVTVRKK